MPTIPRTKGAGGFGQAKDRSVSTCFEKNFYSYLGSEGKRNHNHESRMAKDIEAPFNELLPLFESDLYVVCSSHSAIICRYVSNLFHRTHQRRLASLVMQKETMQAAKEMVSDPLMLRQLAAVYSFAEQKPASLISIRDSIIRLYEGNSEDANQTQFLENLVRYEDDLAEMLRGRPYGLLRAPTGSEFVISDTGVITRQVIGEHVIAVGVGFTRDRTHALLPISPRVCLRRDEVDSINRDSIRLMHRYVYSREYSQQIEGAVKQYGGELRYTENAFMRRKVTPELMLQFFAYEILGGKDILRFMKPLMEI
jgi:hypothetical protein